MRKFLLLFFIPFNISFAQQTDYKAKSTKIFEQIRNREFSSVTALFDTNISKRIDTTRLRSTWDKLLPIAGPFVKVISIEKDTSDTNNAIIQHLQFEKRKIDFKLVYSENGKIKGIMFLPDKPRERYKLPDYHKPELIKDSVIAIQDGPFRLPGILTKPNKAGRFPAVILIHGSGPNDKDETVGPMKIFKDISIGLAQQGVAVYRYEKRTRVYSVVSALNKNFTVKDETLEDAVSAYKLLKKDSTIDSTAIYLCGHGMGGMLLPRIAKIIPGVKGLIYLGSNSRPLEDIQYEQTAYVLGFDTIIKDHKSYLDSIKREVTKIKMLKPTDKDSSFIFRLPHSYWIDMNKYNPVKTAEELKTPMLFIFGDRDYQVTDADLNLWKSGLKGPNVEFKSYKNLNHFFITGVGKSVPSEYGKSANVDITMINDMANWILSTSKK